MFDLPLQIAFLMRDFKPPWFVAGGWAIDLFLEKTTRFHADIEIAIFRRDQIVLHDYFDNWLLQKIANGVPSVWHRDERLQLPTHEIWCFNQIAKPPRIEILLNESNETDWLYRRNQNIKLPLAKCWMKSSAGINFLCPEIVLLYKSKNPRFKDEQDFQIVIKNLDAKRRKWLRKAIAICDVNHLWLQSL